MQQNPVGWFEIYVDVVDRAKKFYEKVFGVNLDRIPWSAGTDKGELCLFPMEMSSFGAPGALVKMKGISPGGGTIVYFTCDDCAKEEQRAAANGGKVFRSKTSIGEHGFISIVNDTEGNLVGLHSMK